MPNPLFLLLFLPLCRKLPAWPRHERDSCAQWLTEQRRLYAALAGRQIFVECLAEILKADDPTDTCSGRVRLMVRRAYGNSLRGGPPERIPLLRKRR